MVRKFRNLISVIMGLCVLSAVLSPAGALTVTPVKENNLNQFECSCEFINISEISDECLVELLEISEYNGELSGDLSVQFSLYMLEDEFYKDIFAKIMTDYKEDVEKQDDGIILKGKALEAFDELCYEKELKEGVEYPAEMFAEEPFKDVLKTIKKNYSAFVEEKDGMVLLKEKALETFDQKCSEMCSEIELSDMEIAFNEFGENGSAYFPSEMLEDELFKDIFDKIMTDYKEDVEKQDDGIILKGKALEAFDQEFFKINSELFVDEISVEVDGNESGLIAVSPGKATFCFPVKK